MANSFQTKINVELGFGIPGNLYDDGPVRSAPYELVSASANYNVVGATAYVVTAGDPGNGSGSATASAGGAGVFAGILMNNKVYATSGGTGGALTTTMTLPNYTIGELISMGGIIVALPGPAAIGDSVCYDQTTGALSTYPALTKFTAALSTPGILSVSAVTVGQIQTGMIVPIPGVGNVTVIGLGTGTGQTGTYTVNSLTTQSVAASALTATSLPPVAATFTGVMTTAGILSATAIVSGQLQVGSVLYGTSVPANCTITGLGTGLGGTGTYTISPAPASLIAAEAMTADATIQIPNAVVYRVAPPGNSVGVIKLTN